MENTTQLIDRYVRMWNEPDVEARRGAIADVWARHGRQVVQPPTEIIDTARALGFPSPTLEVAGHDDLEFRVTRAYEEFVVGGQHVFRVRPHGARLGDVVLFGWDMVDQDGNVVGGGTEVLVLDHDDRIVTDYQFIDP
jgi:hypothetical protein